MRSIIKLILINLLLLASGLLIIELVLGGWLKPSKIYMVGIERDITRQIKLHGLYEWPEDVIHYSRNHWGFRGGPDNPKEIELLTVGGSTTEQLYISDGHTWQDICRDELEKSGMPLNISNAGIDGQSSYGHIKNISWWFSKVPGLKPRHILYYVGINDFVKINPEGTEELAENEDSLEEYVKENSAFFRGWRLVSGHIKAKSQMDVTHQQLEIKPEQWVANPYPVSDYATLMEKHLNGYEGRLRLLVQKTREFGSEPILMTQPTWWYRRDRGQLEILYHGFFYNDKPLTGMDFYYMMQLLNNRTLQVAQDTGCVAFDLERELVFTEGDMYDYGHYTPQGAERIGIYLAGKLRELYGSGESER